MPPKTAGFFKITKLQACQDVITKLEDFITRVETDSAEDMLNNKAELLALARHELADWEKILQGLKAIQENKNPSV